MPDDIPCVLNYAGVWGQASLQPDLEHGVRSLCSRIRPVSDTMQQDQTGQ